ncbi:MAG: DUF1538 domain-containing protein [Oscillospiraceae bacterium]|nr:DUF1538 domain-containing protein [Oscillospiraceae bacterium]
MNLKLKEKLQESLSAVLPITGIVLLLSILLVPMDLGTAVMFMVGALMLVIGMGFFQLGAEMSMTPLGKGIGIQMEQTRSIPLILLIGFLMGAIITIAEPDLQVLANQVPSVPNMTLILTVALGVGSFLALAILRILLQISLSTILSILYLALILLSFLVPEDFLAVAFDSGGVTTGPITVPFIMAMGVGLASLRGDRKATSDSFGLVALSSVGPVLAVMLLGSFFQPDSGAYSLPTVPDVLTTRDVVRVFVFELPHYLKEVLFSILPLAAMFGLFQWISRRFRSQQLKQVGVGFVYTLVGLVLFLAGVNVGFSPVGMLLGGGLANSQWKWLLLPIGMLIGYYIVKAEPAIQVLNHQIQDVTNGSISAKSMNYALSLGVAVSVGLSMLRVLTAIPIQWILIPGYCIALLLSRLVPTLFVGIAFDSGGVASGPMTTTFLLPLSMGVCEALGGNMMTDAFGVVALVALTPLISIQLMGVLYQHKLKKMERIAAMEAELVGGDDIIDLDSGEEIRVGEESTDGT